MSIFMIMPPEMAEHIAKQAQEKRLSLNMSQQTLAERSGVLKKFERTGARIPAQTRPYLRNARSL